MKKRKDNRHTKIELNYDLCYVNKIYHINDKLLMFIKMKSQLNINNMRISQSINLIMSNNIKCLDE